MSNPAPVSEAEYLSVSVDSWTPALSHSRSGICAGLKSGSAANTTTICGELSERATANSAHTPNTAQIPI